MENQTNDIKERILKYWPIIISVFSAVFAVLSTLVTSVAVGAILVYRLQTTEGKVTEINNKIENFILVSNTHNTEIQLIKGQIQNLNIRLEKLENKIEK